jgi:hypothetical protein
MSEPSHNPPAEDDAETRGPALEVRDLRSQFGDNVIHDDLA